MNEYRASRSPPSTLSSRKRGLNGLSFRYAETGVSRSAAMSNGGFTSRFLVLDLQRLPEPVRARGDKKPISGRRSEMGFLDTSAVFFVKPGALQRPSPVRGATT